MNPQATGLRVLLRIQASEPGIGGGAAASWKQPSTKKKLKGEDEVTR